MADITNPHGARDPQPPGDPNVETGPHGAHEIRDVDIRAVTGFVIGVVLLMMVVMTVFWFTFDTVADLATPKAGERPAMAGADPLKRPPEPRLQATPIPDLGRFQQGEEAILHHYGWVDPDKGIVRIPVARAMELVAKEGLPFRGSEGAARPAAPAAKAQEPRQR